MEKAAKTRLQWECGMNMLNTVKDETNRQQTDSLGIKELKWTGTGCLQREYIYVIYEKRNLS